MRRQVAVIGLGRFGSSIARTLFGLGHDVLAMDTDEKLVNSISSQVTHAVQADGTDEAVLKELGVPGFHVAIVAVGDNVKSSVLCTILLKKLGLRYVIARADDELHGDILERIGADKVVHPEQEMGTTLAHSLTLTDLQDYMAVAAGGYGIAKVAAPSYFVGRTLADLGLGQDRKWRVAVLLLLRGKEVLVNPGRSEVVQSGDVLVTAGTDDNLERLLSDAQKPQDRWIR